MKKFEDMTLNEKRVQIAKDVLAQVRAKRIKPTRGDWANFKSLTGKHADKELR